MKIAPSILSADQANLKWAIDEAYEGKADYIHVDVMDFHFVPNLTIGPSVCADIAKNSLLPLDVHLMVDDPAGFAGVLSAQLQKRVMGVQIKFEGLSDYPTTAIRGVIQKIEIPLLARALKGAGEDLFTNILACLEKENSAELVTEMGNTGTIKRSDIKSAREEITQSLNKATKINPVKFLVAHQEACIHLDGVLNYFRDSGFSPGVALNPATPVSTIEQILHLCDIVVVMSVNPGFGGQEFIPYSLDKVRQLKKIIEGKHLSTVIEIDGGITPENAGYAARAGCDILVAGAAVFNDMATPAENIKALKNACARAV